LVEGQLAIGGELRGGWVEVRNGRIAAVETGRPPRAPDRAAYVVSRGLCDLQVNGAGGHNVTDGMDALQAIDQIQLAHGVTSYLPTIITTSEEEATEAVATIRSRMRNANSPIVGVHLEGPFLDQEHRGVHRAEQLLTPEDGVPPYVWSEAVRMVTIAPELPGALELIKELVARNIIVSIGHTNASETQAETAFQAGASSVTHLFNAMRRFEHRHPNVPGWGLTRAGVMLGVIPDGFHVHPMVLALVDRVARDRVILVTDATPAAAAPPGRPYLMAGVHVESKEGRVATREGHLAGSALTLDAALRDWIAHTGSPVAPALEAASDRPSRFLGLPSGLEPGDPADLVLLDERLSVEGVVAPGGSMW
jgi:N-acetylglucosamine-6-phosphate deacetylase